MTTLTTALNTAFTPATGVFTVQSSGGAARLDRSITAANAWTPVGNVAAGQVFVVENPVVGMDYMFVPLNGDPTVRADQ